MSNTELETEETMVTYREKIIHRINDIDNVNFLKFIYKLLDAFKRKWGV